MNKELDFFRPMSLQGMMDRFFEPSFFPAEMKKDFISVPKYELTEDAEKYKVCLDVPGMKKEEIKIEMDERGLWVSGERKTKKEENTEKRRFTEITYGSFQRLIPFPAKVNPEKVTAALDNGVLTVTAAKANGLGTRQITVK